MKKLTREAFDKAKTFIFSHGRKLDQQLFNHHFEAGNLEAVLAELACYQNLDGGFGHALEPDLRTPASSVVATSQAFYVLRELDVPVHLPMVQRAVTYLLQQYDPQRQVWPIIPPEADDAPHASHWAYQDAEPNFGDFLVNPRFATVGHLYHYAALVPSDFLAQVTNVVLGYLGKLPEEMDVYDMYSCLGLVEAKNFPEGERDQVAATLLPIIRRSLVHDQSRWGVDCVKPLTIAPSPNSHVGYSIPPTEIAANLDYEIEHQLADGSWPLGWPCWSVAEQEWKSHVTLAKLTTLYAYDRIERG
jgi:hypothetical protein